MQSKRFKKVLLTTLTAWSKIKTLQLTTMSANFTKALTISECSKNFTTVISHWTFLWFWPLKKPVKTSWNSTSSITSLPLWIYITFWSAFGKFKPLKKNTRTYAKNFKQELLKQTLEHRFHHFRKQLMNWKWTLTFGKRMRNGLRKRISLSRRKKFSK